MLNVDEIKIRCSQIGKIMSEPKAKNVIYYFKDGLQITEKVAFKLIESGKTGGIYSKTERVESDSGLSEGAKTYLAELFINKMYGREKDIESKYITKGLRVEEDSITLYSLFANEFFKKNAENIQNEFISGTPDLFTGTSIHKAEKIIDVKSSWDIFTFFANHPDKIKKMYYYQLQGYMALTGAQSAVLAYCLTDTPPELVFDAKERLKWKMGVIDPSVNKEYLEACEKIDKLSIYSDIPSNKRVITVDIERNDSVIEEMYEKVRQSRLWIKDTYLK